MQGLPQLHPASCTALGRHTHPPGAPWAEGVPTRAGQVQEGTGWQHAHVGPSTGRGSLTTDGRAASREPEALTTGVHSGPWKQPQISRRQLAHVGATCSQGTVALRRRAQGPLSTKF